MNFLNNRQCLAIVIIKNTSLELVRIIVGTGGTNNIAATFYNAVLL